MMFHAPADDLDHIMAVMAAAFPPEYGEAWTRRQVEDALLIGACHYVLIDAEGHPPAHGTAAAGFALLRTAHDEEELLLLAVVPGMRRRGLGAALLGHVLETARGRGTVQILLEMRRDNIAESLYRKAGFQPIGLRPNYYRAADGTRIDALTFRCLLT